MNEPKASPLSTVLVILALCALGWTSLGLLIGYFCH